MLTRAIRRSVFAIAALVTACGGPTHDTVLTFSGSALGPEAEVVGRQLARFNELHPEVHVELRVTPDAADQRHQLYVQWLNARAAVPDVLQLDVIWTAEFAAAGWILPLNRFAPEIDDFLPGAIAASRWRGVLYAMPWFVDVSLLYWRTDLVGRAPQSLDDLARAVRPSQDRGQVRYGLVWSGARYEGLITVFLEYLDAFGGGILSDDGQVIVDRPAAIEALTFLCREVAAGGVSPPSVLNWREEEVRLAFQNGDAMFMRNWPYAWPLLQQASQSRVAGRVAVAPLPARDSRSAAALGGAQLAINAQSEHPQLAWSLIRFLSAPEQMIERARLAAQLPPRRSLYETAALADALPIPIPPLRQALESASPRPVTPVYSELSEILQVRVHRALTGQEAPDAALRDAASEMRTLLSRSGLAASPAAP
jgi:ABC-type glycerol-3-phosphate transport system substrate-binding protein